MDIKLEKGDKVPNTNGGASRLAANKTRKRNRVPISCTICRRRKVKCDKGKPTCVNCKKNGVQHLCFYLQPTWAKELDEKELKYPLTSKEKDKPEHSDTDSINKDEEIQKLRLKIEQLEQTVLSQQQRMVSAVPNNTTPATSIATPKDYPQDPNAVESALTLNRSPAIPNNPYTIGLAEIDLVKNFNILYTSKRNTKNQFPIIYQISIMSWLFIIKNDVYLNDLWIKIFNLRKYYEHQFTATDGSESTKRILELSKQTNTFISNIKNSKSKLVASPLFSKKSNVAEEVNFNNFDFDNNQPRPQECPVTRQVAGECPVIHDLLLPAIPLKRSLDKVAGSCPVEHSKLTTFKKLPQLTPQQHSVLQCPIIRHNGGLKQLASESKCPVIMPDLARLAEDDDNDDYKVCPLMIGDAKNIFRERLQHLSSSGNVASTELGSSLAAAANGKECPVIGCDSNAAKRRKTGTKKLKTLSLLPSDVRSMNFGSPKEVILVFERHLPCKKIAWMLIQRFFDKLYLHLPIIDEYSFRERVSKIIGTKESAAGQKIKLSDLGSDYSEDFLTLCLMVIILRLSWLTLPSNLPKKFQQTAENSQDLTADEKILIRPENLISMVLIDLIKEIFSSMRILSTPSVVIVQVGILLKYYNVLAPEDGFELDDSYNGSSHSNGVSPGKETLNLNSSVFLNSLISLAKTIGLNRDPLNFKNFESKTSDESVNIHFLRRRHLWRKMWYSLINMNVLTNLSLGDYSKHLNIEVDATNGGFNDFWDTKRPSTMSVEDLKKCFPDFEGSSDHNFQRELKVVQLMDLEYKINILVYRGMKLLLDVKTLPLKADVDLVLTQLTNLVHEEDGDNLEKVKTSSGLTCAELLVKFDRFKESELSGSARIFEFKLFLMIKMLMFVLNYILFLNYELKLKELLSENGIDPRKMVEDPTYLDGADPQLVEAIEYNKKIFDQHFERTLLLAIDNYNIFIQFFDNSNKFFPNMGAELLIYPFLMLLNHRSKQFIISLVLRLQQNDPIISQILIFNGINKEELLNKLFGYLKIFLGKLDKLTKHYYYAWRLKKLMKFFYNVLISFSKLFTSNYTKMLTKTGNGSEQCPVLQDIKTSTTPVLANQRTVALKARDLERERQAVAAASAIDLQQFQVNLNQETLEPFLDDQTIKQENSMVEQLIPPAAETVVPLDGNTPANGTTDFDGPPSEFATQMLNRFSEDLNTNTTSTENQPLDIFDEIMLDNFPISDRNFFGNATTSQGFDPFGDDGFLDNHHNYGVNEIDFTNVDLNTLPVYSENAAENGSGETVNGNAELNGLRLPISTWFQSFH